MSEHPDVSAAELIIDGCNMGIRSIYKYFNKYPAADAEIKDLLMISLRKRKTFLLN